MLTDYLKLSETVKYQRSPALGWVMYHPQAEVWLTLAGLRSAEDFLGVPGVVVSGHPERHVREVTLDCHQEPIRAYLKVEHVVGWRTRWTNWRAGAGWVSRSQREAETLQLLERSGLPHPEWLAYGEDSSGRAFLLIREVTGLPLLDALKQRREQLPERLGIALAQLHQQGISPQDLCAKHVFINDDVVMIDWLNRPRQGFVSERDIVRQWTNLLTSLPDGRVSHTDCWRALRAYCRARQLDPKPLARTIVAVAGRRRQRPSLQDQRSGEAPRWIWLDGEALCVTPELMAYSQLLMADAPFYWSRATQRPEWYRLPTVMGRVERFVESCPVSRWWATVTCKNWRSRGVRLARVLTHLARHGVPSPRLLAFGQRVTPGCQAHSFVYYHADPLALPLGIRLTQSDMTSSRRKQLLKSVGSLLARLHQSRARLGSWPELVVGRGELWPQLGSAAGVELRSRLSDIDRLTDHRTLFAQHPGWSPADRRAVIQGYSQACTALPRRRLLAALA